MRKLLRGSLFSGSNHSPVKVDIWGSCVTRDACEIGVKKGSITVNNYIQDCNFSVQFTPHILPNITKESIDSDIIDFDKRNIVFDWNKTIISNLQKSDSRWLIIDPRAEAYGIYKITTSYGVEYISGNKIESVKKTLNKMGIEYELQSVDSSDPCIKKGFEDFVDFCKRKYRDKIILLEVFETTVSQQKDGAIDYNDYITRYSSLEQDVEKEASFNYRFGENVDCYFIKMPFNVIADTSHKWGLGPVHYVDKYYRFVYDSLMVIFHDKNNVYKEINKLLRKYESIFASIRYEKKQSLSAFVNHCKEEMESGNTEEVKQTILSLLGNNEPELMLHIDYLLDTLWQFNDSQVDVEMVKIIRASANDGNRFAIERLGRAYMEGRGVEKDLEEAARLMRVSISYGNDYARIYLFDILWQLNDPQADIEMVGIIRPFAENGNKDAIERLGRAYMEGRGVEKDLEEAARLMGTSV